jgi:hypothetical protein
MKAEEEEGEKLKPRGCSLRHGPMEGAREWQWRASWCMSTRSREGAREWSGEVRGALGVELALIGLGEGRGGSNGR